MKTRLSFSPIRIWIRAVFLWTGPNGYFLPWASARLCQGLIWNDTSTDIWSGLWPSALLGGNKLSLEESERPTGQEINKLPLDNSTAQTSQERKPERERERERESEQNWDWQKREKKNKSLSLPHENKTCVNKILIAYWKKQNNRKREKGIFTPAELKCSRACSYNLDDWYIILQEVPFKRPQKLLCIRA